MRKPYPWNNRTRKAVCRLCGKPFTAHYARERYCHRPDCDALLAEFRRQRRKKLRRLRLVAKLINARADARAPQETAQDNARAPQDTARDNARAPQETARGDALSASSQTSSQVQ